MQGSILRDAGRSFPSTARNMNSKLRRLTESEFEATFSPPMNPVAEIAVEVVDIWEYAEQVVAEDFVESSTKNWRHECSYESSDGQWQHILIETDVPDAYIVIVCDCSLRSIAGHYFLNIRQKFGLLQ